MKKVNHSAHIDTLKEVSRVLLVWIYRKKNSHLRYILLPSFELSLGYRCLLVGEVSIVGYSRSVEITPV